MITKKTLTLATVATLLAGGAMAADISAGTGGSVGVGVGNSTLSTGAGAGLGVATGDNTGTGSVDTNTATGADVDSNVRGTLHSQNSGTGPGASRRSNADSDPTWPGQTVNDRATIDGSTGTTVAPASGDASVHGAANTKANLGRSRGGLHSGARAGVKAGASSTTGSY